MTVDDNRERAVQNALGHSRTARGVLDVTSTAAKAQQVVTNLNPDSLSLRTTDQVRMAAVECWTLSETPLDRGEAVLAVIDRTNGLITSGIVLDGLRYRTSPSRHPYADPDRAVKLLYQFTETWADFEAGHSNSTAVDLAAFAVWVIDLYGHPFTDGCGKTGSLIAAMILDRAKVRVPIYPERSEFIESAYRRGRLSWSRWHSSFVALVGRYQ